MERGKGRSVPLAAPCLIRDRMSVGTLAEENHRKPYERNILLTRVSRVTLDINDCGGVGRSFFANVYKLYTGRNTKIK